MTKIPIKVAYLLTIFPKLSETFILQELLELERLGVEIEIIALEKSNEKETHKMMDNLKAKINYISVLSQRRLTDIILVHLSLFIRYPLSYPRGFLYAITRGEITAFRRFLLCGHIIPILEKNNIKHIHVHFADSATRIAKFIHMITGISYSFTTHATDLYANDKIHTHRMRKRIRLARYVVTISDYNKKQIENAGFRIKPGKVRRIYNGIDLENFPLSNYPVDEYNVIRILSIGRLVEKKGFEYLIRACKNLTDKGYHFKCIIIGDGPLQEKLSNLIIEMKLQNIVSLIGARTQEKIIEKYYPNTSLFTLPCIVTDNGDRDGIPMVLIESMAMGIPVISTEISGIPELVKNGESGTLVPEKNIDALTSAMEELICQPDLRQKYHQIAPNFIQQNFDIHKNGRELRRLFRKTVQS